LYSSYKIRKVNDIVEYEPENEDEIIKNKETKKLKNVDKLYKFKRQGLKQSNII
jgi:hypothetical protein